MSGKLSSWTAIDEKIVIALIVPDSRLGAQIGRAHV
jgi:hypothetical protein